MSTKQSDDQNPTPLFAVFYAFSPSFRKSIRTLIGDRRPQIVATSQLSTTSICATPGIAAAATAFVPPPLVVTRSASPPPMPRREHMLSPLRRGGNGSSSLRVTSAAYRSVNLVRSRFLLTREQPLIARDFAVRRDENKAACRRRRRNNAARRRR